MRKQEHHQKREGIHGKLKSVGQFSMEKQQNTRICSDNFASGKPAGLYDTQNKDWAPSLDLGHEKCKAPASSSFDRYE